MVLETAVTGLADCIVTGDQDLLVLDPFRNIRILTPATFLAALAAEDKG
jgi:predicted nucleic acid-binding protein